MEDQKRSEEKVSAFAEISAAAVAKYHEVLDGLGPHAYAVSAYQCMGVLSAVELAYRAGREDAARPALLAEVLYRYIDRVRERRAHSTQGQYHPEFYKGMKHAADLIAANAFDAEIDSREAIKAEIARGSSGSDERRDSNG